MLVDIFLDWPYIEAEEFFLYAKKLLINMNKVTKRAIVGMVTNPNSITYRAEQLPLVPQEISSFPPNVIYV